MSLLSKVADFFTGGIGETIVDTVEKYFPPDLTPQQKADIKLAMQKIDNERQAQLMRLAAEQEREFNDRIRDLEGTARDLTQFGWLGRIVVFFRGCQRPIWGGMTLYMDLKWFSGQWPDMTDQQESALWIINLLVLGFLFGERAIKNVMPLITSMIEKRNK